MSHVEWRVTSCLLSGDAVSPEDVSCVVRPLSDVAVTCLDEGVLYGVVRAFDNAIRFRVIRRDANVSDVVFVGKPVKCSNEWGTIVRHDFLSSSPSAEYLFK